MPSSGWRKQQLGAGLDPAETCQTSWEGQTMVKRRMLVKSERDFFRRERFDLGVVDVPGT
jgi:hypothetical protein